MTMDKCAGIRVMISGYLDGELTQQQRQQVSTHVEDCPHCRREFEDMSALKQRMAELSYPASDEDMLAALEQDPVARASAGLGWMIVIGGILVMMTLAGLEFVTADELPWYEKLGIALLVLGPLALLVSVIRQRVMTYKHDKYRKVKL